MKLSRKRLHPGWSFAAGTLFGALAVLAPIASSGTSTPKVADPTPGQLVAADSDASSAPRDLQISLEAPEPASVEPVPTAPRKTRQRPPTTANQSAHHSELDLQLD